MTDTSSPKKEEDGIALTVIPHPPMFPWPFVHKLVNVLKRKQGQSDDC